ncbi:hypothetical protein DFH11DRAFT_1731160 [Phellopilus nigrolimitatus]|nr:hypothetical protein DFH11DRAFT_1731160 [Phellopilus nigrolimitatus]
MIHLSVLGHHYARRRQSEPIGTLGATGKPAYRCALQLGAGSWYQWDTGAYACAAFRDRLMWLGADMHVPPEIITPRARRRAQRRAARAGVPPPLPSETEGTRRRWGGRGGPPRGRRRPSSSFLGLTLRCPALLPNLHTAGGGRRFFASPDAASASASSITNTDTYADAENENENEKEREKVRDAQAHTFWPGRLPMCAWVRAHADALLAAALEPANTEEDAGAWV